MKLDGHMLFWFGVYWGLSLFNFLAVFDCSLEHHWTWMTFHALLGAWLGGAARNYLWVFLGWSQELGINLSTDSQGE